MPTETAKLVVQKMYIAYYGRPADLAGLDFWATQLDNTGGTDISSLVNGFGASAEFTDRFAGQSSDQLVENIYQFIYTRPADAGGKAFYVGRLNSGESSLANIALDILNGSINDDLTVANNKLLTAAYLSTVVERSGSTYGAEQINAAKAVLDNVTALSGPDYQAAGNTADTFPGGRGDGFNYAPSTFGDDVVRANANSRDALIGLIGADIFEFQTGESTLSSLDRVSDYKIGEGDKIDYFNADALIAPNITGFNVNAAFGGSGDITATITNGIISLSGIDAGAVDTLEEWTALARTGLLAEGNVAGFGFAGHTFLIRNESNITESLIEITGLNGIFEISNTASSEGTIFVS